MKCRHCSVKREMGDERSWCLTLVGLQTAVVKAAGLNAALIAPLSCLPDLPQLAGQGHRPHAVCGCARACTCVCVCVLVCSLYICQFSARIDVTVCVAFNVLMSVFVLHPSCRFLHACVRVCVRAWAQGLKI